MLDTEAMNEALRKAEIAVGQGCKATQRASLAIAVKAMEAVINQAGGELGQRARLASDYAKRQSASIKTYAEEIKFLREFWEGFNHGWNEHPQLMDESASYQAGYNYGAYGTEASPDITEELELGSIWDGQDTD